MNKRIEILDTLILSDKKYQLKEVTFTVDGSDEQKKEVYNRTNSATVLMYNTAQKTVILTKQFRLPTYLNGNKSGMLVEACAGMIDKGETAEECMRREAIEETGYELEALEKVYETYMSPAAVPELITLFIAPYTAAMKTHEGGGLQEENENIEVLEISFEKAMSMMEAGEIRDAKTIMLLQHIKLKGLM